MCIFNHACICCLYKLAPTVRPTQNMRVHLGKKAIKKTNQSTNNQWIEPSRAPSICLLVHRSHASPDTMIHAQLARSARDERSSSDISKRAEQIDPSGACAVVVVVGHGPTEGSRCWGCWSGTTPPALPAAAGTAAGASRR